MALATEPDRGREVSRGHSSRLSDEGLNLLMQGTDCNNSKDTARQQGVEPTTRLGLSGGGGTESAGQEEPQVSAALEQKRALTINLMEQVCQRENLNRAYRKVKANKGAPGVDQMTVHELGGWITEHKQELITSLLEGSYQPEPVRGVEIPKPGGGMRQLGIPTVIDRLVQQAILQVLEPLLDPTFSTSSYGFRPGRNAHQALQKAQEYVAKGRGVVVDIDLEKFFRPGQSRHSDVTTGEASG